MSMFAQTAGGRNLFRRIIPAGDDRPPIQHNSILSRGSVSKLQRRDRYLISNRLYPVVGNTRIRHQQCYLQVLKGVQTPTGILGNSVPSDDKRVVPESGGIQ